MTLSQWTTGNPYRHSSHSPFALRASAQNWPVSSNGMFLYHTYLSPSKKWLVGPWGCDNIYIYMCFSLLSSHFPFHIAKLVQFGWGKICVNAVILICMNV